MGKRIVHLLSLWLPVVVWASLIFIGSSLPTFKATPSYWSDYIVKKVGHLVEYFILYLLTWRALKNHLSSKPFFLTFLLIFLYAVFDEMHQSFVPGREPHPRDVIIDALGGGMGVWFLKYLLPKLPRKLKNWLSASPGS